jgi:hypothetical protein
MKWYKVPGYQVEVTKMLFMLLKMELSGEIEFLIRKVKIIH